MCRWEALRSEALRNNPIICLCEERGDVTHALSRASLRLAIPNGIASTKSSSMRTKNNLSQNLQRAPSMTLRVINRIRLKCSLGKDYERFVCITYKYIFLYLFRPKQVNNSFPSGDNSFNIYSLLSPSFLSL